MRKEVNLLQKKSAEVDTLSALIYEYKNYVKSFEWLTIREVIIDRLEGSRRSIKGHHLESSIRIALVTAIQTFFVINGNYGKYTTVEVAPKQIKIGSHTIDVSAKFTSNDDDLPDVNLLIPIKTRETEGGGHSHLFTRDIMQAISNLENDINYYHIVAVIIAQNWSSTEIVNINNDIDYVFHFKMNLNRFIGFDEDSQIKLNQYIGNILQ